MSLMGAIETVKKLHGEKAAERLEKRIAKMTTYDLMTWSDTAIMGIAAAYSAWRGESNIDFLAEARLNTAQLLHALEELHRRESK